MSRYNLWKIFSPIFSGRSSTFSKRPSIFLSIFAVRAAKHCCASSFILKVCFLTSSRLLVRALLYVFCLAIGSKNFSVARFSTGRINLLQKKMAHLQCCQQRTALCDSEMSISTDRGRTSSVPVTDLDNLDRSLCTSWHPPSSLEALRVHRKSSPRLRRIDLPPKIRVSTLATRFAVNHEMKCRLTNPNGKLENPAYASWYEYV